MGKEREEKQNGEVYAYLDKQIRKKCNKAKDNWLNEQCNEIESKM